MSPWRVLTGVCLGFNLLNGAVGSLSAQTLVANAQISAAANGPSTFDYTITLSNSSASTAPIKTFWYAWLPGGGNYLPTNPLSVQSPAGWDAAVTGGGPGDGYSIRFQASTAPIAPGSSLNFGFSSSDTPAALSQTSLFYPGVPIESSTVYSGHLAGVKATFLVQPIPEPSTLSLLAVGSVALLLVGRRKGQRS